MVSERKPDDLTERERAALHEVELGVENLHRAHGHLVSFHHSTGRAMDHLAEAEELLRECGHDSFADELRDEYLPRGVVAGPGAEGGGRWSYDILETFQETFLDDIVAFGRRVSEDVADGLRHAAERKQEADWKRRAKQD